MMGISNSSIQQAPHPQHESGNVFAEYITVFSFASGLQEVRTQSNELFQENLLAAFGCLNASALTKLLEQLHWHCCMMLNGIIQYVQAPCTAHIVKAEVDDVHHDS